ncbi:MAG: class I SAM-dependent methyltransferase [Acidobacteriota bacterium]|nr:class I SAM-dependent methyltransferase [Acidobacteriota bacterium]
MSLFQRLAHRPKPYRLRDLRRRERLRPDYDLLADFLLRELSFESAIDVGCGNGFLLERFHDAGKRIAGVDVSPDVPVLLGRRLNGAVRVADFGAAVGTFDLACCVEVAEHIAPDRSLSLVETLTRVARTWIYFSAAPEGQAGRGHINCRPHAEWLRWFEARGWHIEAASTELLREHLQKLELAPWLRGNSFLIRHAGKGHHSGPAEFFLNGDEPRAVRAGTR